MSYTPTEWKSGDVVTAAKLNKIEDGIANAGGGGGAFCVDITMTDNGGVPHLASQKTWQEIHDALDDGLNAFGLVRVSEDSVLGFVSLPIYMVMSQGGLYGVIVLYMGADIMLMCDSADGYPEGDGGSNGPDGPVS